MAEIVNGTCHAEKAPLNSPPLFQHGNIVFQAHHVGWIVTGFFTTMAIVASSWLINKHLQWYTNKREQRYIVRLLFMVPIYAVISFASYLFWNHSTPLLLLRDCYEAVVLTAFFYLLLMYLSPDPEEQKDVFRKVGLSRENDRELVKKGHSPKKWMFPLNFVRWKPQDGLYFLQLMKWGVLQYCVIRPMTTLAAVILDYIGMYCESSWSPGWGHVYITVIVSISVSIAMYCLIQLYVPISAHLKPHKPLLKLFAVKAVVFLTFWQATGLSLLTMLGIVKDTQYMTAENINIGIGAILETFEMMLFAFLHIRAFTYKPYRTSPNRTPRLRAIAHAMNFKETIRELWAGIVYMAHRIRGRETDIHARREAAMESVFGRSRIDIKSGSKALPTNRSKKNAIEEGLQVEVAVEKTMHVNEEKQWLGLGDDYAYGFGYHLRRQRERSDGLQEQIEKELTARGYARRSRPQSRVVSAAYDPIGQHDGQRAQRPWWRDVYARLSQTGSQDYCHENPVVNSVQKGSRSRPLSREPYSAAPIYDPLQQDYDDPPPLSVIRSYRESRIKQANADTRVHDSSVSDNPPSLISASFMLPSRQPSLPQATTAAAPVSELSQAEPLPRDIRMTPARPRLAPLLFPPTESDHSDRVFGRAFTNVTDVSHSVKAFGVIPSSSRSNHAHQVRLAGEPAIIANRASAPRLPVVTHLADGRPDNGSYPPLTHSERPNPPLSRAQPALSPVDIPPRPNYEPAPMSSSKPLPIPRQSDVRAERSSCNRQEPRNFPPGPPKPHVLRRDQVVLPAPLAPAARSPRSHRLTEEPDSYATSPSSPPISDVPPGVHLQAQRGNQPYLRSPTGLPPTRHSRSAAGFSPPTSPFMRDVPRLVHSRVENDNQPYLQSPTDLSPAHHSRSAAAFSSSPQSRSSRQHEARLLYPQPPSQLQRSQHTNGKRRSYPHPQERTHRAWETRRTSAPPESTILLPAEQQQGLGGKRSGYPAPPLRVQPTDISHDRWGRLPAPR